MHGGLFAPIVPALARRHRVHVVDLPGHGRSPPMPPFDLPTLADAIGARNGEDPRPLTVLGWSLGGQVALQWASVQPGTRRAADSRFDDAVVRRSRRLAACDVTRDARAFRRRASRRFPADAAALSGAAGARQRRRAQDARTIADAPFRARRTVAGHAGGRYRIADANGSASDVAADSRSRRWSLAAIATRWCRWRQRRALAGALPAATHIAIAGAAHAPFLSHRAAFLDALASFLVRNAPTPDVLVPLSND